MHSSASGAVRALTSTFREPSSSALTLGNLGSWVAAPTAAWTTASPRGFTG